MMEPAWKYKPYPEYKDSGIEWLGEFPKHWSNTHLRCIIKDFIDYRGKTPEKVDYGVPLITAKNIKNGKIDISLSEEYIRKNHYDDWMVRGLPENGDVLVTTEAPLGEVAQIIDNTRIALAQRIILLKTYKDIYINEYIKYHFMSSYGQSELYTRASGSTAIGIRADRFKSSKILIPPISEQQAIASFLDRETARIDELIAKKEQLIALLEEKRTALISHAVTKGLNPDAKMKDSGIEWLGEVPEHWETLNLKRVFSKVDYGISQSLHGTGKYGILRMGDIQNGEVLLGNLGYVDSVPHELILEYLDLLFNRTNSLALVGKVGIFRGTKKDNISCASYLVRFRVRKPYNPEYFCFLLNTPEILTVASRMALPAIGQANLNPNRYGYLKVCLPPADEQNKIVQYIKEKRINIDDLIIKNHIVIEKLQEYRTALISAAVTGKIDVRNEVN